MFDEGDRSVLFTVNVSLYGLIEGELFKLIRFWYLVLESHNI